MADTPTFGIELRRMRIAAGLSLAELARQLNYSKGYLSKIETGVTPPNEDLARRCDARLGAGGALAALVRPKPVRANENETGDHDDDAEVWLMSLGPDGESTFLPMRRRDILLAGMATLATVTGPARTVPAETRAEDPVRLFENLFAQTRKLGQTTSPTLVLPLVVAQAQALRVLADQGRPASRTRLALLAARNAEYAGWMAQEAGDNKVALWWTRKAVSIAAEVGHHDLAAYALVRQALVTLYQRDARSTIMLAQRAQADSRTPPRILGLAAQREAQGHALAGDYDDCMRALDRAAELLRIAANEPSDGPVIGTSHVADPVAVVAGWCMYDLGRPGQAAEILDREVAKIPRGAARAWVRFGARRALAHASAGEVDHACGLTAELLESVATVDSETIMTDIRQLAATLRRWQSRHTAVRELDLRLTAALRRAPTG